MVEVKQYHLPPTPLIPNSPYPLLYYPGFLLSPPHSQPDPSLSNKSYTATTATTPKISSSGDGGGGSSSSSSSSEEIQIPPLQVHDLFTNHKWETQWIFRYGATQQSHYHSGVHECIAVLSGRARIRFGVADAEWKDGAEEGEREGEGGVQEMKTPAPLEIGASAGDVFVLPAGVAHKTFSPSPPPAEFQLLTPGDGHHIVPPASASCSSAATFPPSFDDNELSQAERVREALGGVELSGFTMIGAYPVGRKGEWDFAIGGEDVTVEGQGREEGGEGGGKEARGYERVWNVEKPEMDPVLGREREGVCGLWV